MCAVRVNRETCPQRRLSIDSGTRGVPVLKKLRIPTIRPSQDIVCCALFDRSISDKMSKPEVGHFEMAPGLETPPYSSEAKVGYVQEAVVDGSDHVPFTAEEDRKLMLKGNRCQH